MSYTIQDMMPYNIEKLFFEWLKKPLCGEESSDTEHWDHNNNKSFPILVKS